MKTKKLKETALKIFNESIKKVMPDRAVKDKLLELDFDEDIFIVAVGKASWRMAQSAVETIGNKVKKGIVITKYGHSEGKIKKLEIYEAGHPVPDENTIKATKLILNELNKTDKNTRILFLLSGGGSSLFELPLEGIHLLDMQEITESLLKSGANIVEINTVRKHLSSVKGGRFAEINSPRKITTLVLSDVLNDRLDSIASGPAYPDNSTSEEALSILKAYNIDISKRIDNALKKETPNSLDNVESHIIGNVTTVCNEAAKLANEMGYSSAILTTSLDCEAREAGKFLGSIINEIKHNKSPWTPPCAIIAGGETVVHVTGNGTGGRNQELALAAAIKIKGLDEVVLLSAGTDGTDGPTDAAGGLVDGFTYSKLSKAGVNPVDELKRNNSYPALEKTGDLLITGPTGTNVNDLILIMFG
ncbi:MAG: glycerate kinase [Thermotogota bacterium]|nr:glycerate kinase [Thermotogota bacterium]